MVAAQLDPSGPAASRLPSVLAIASRLGSAFFAARALRSGCPYRVVESPI